MKGRMLKKALPLLVWSIKNGLTINKDNIKKKSGFNNRFFCIVKSFARRVER